METRIPTIRISVYEGERLVRDEVFNQKAIRIGKAGQAHLRLADPNVSRQHAVIEVLDSGDIRLTDLESTNGTLLNGERVSQALLRNGDEIVVGTTRLVIHIEGEVVQKSALETFYQAPAIKDEAGLTEEVALEIAVLWHDQVVTVHHFRRGQKVKAGETPGCQVFLPQEYLGEKEVVFAVPENGTFLLNVRGLKEAAGDCLMHGEIIKVADLERKGKLIERDFLRVDVNTRARLRFGPFTLMVSLSRLPEPVRTPFAKRLNIQNNVYTAISFILHILFLIMITLIPEEQLRAVRDPYERRSQVFKMIKVAELEKLAREEMERRKAEEARKKEAERKIEVAERTVGERQKIDVRKPDELLSKLTPEEIRERNKRIAEQALTRVLTQHDDLLSQVLGAGGEPTLGGTDIKVIGSRGPGPLVSGLDPFGGTLGGGTGGFRGTPGSSLFGRSEFGPADLKGIAGLERSEAVKKTEIAIKGGQYTAFTGTAKITGEIDEAIVQRYVRSKMPQIQWCYQMAVQKNPELQGHMTFQWIITPTGKVEAIQVAQTNMASKELEECIRLRIATWVFPAPKGGGMARVTYPFVFKVTK